MKSVVEVNPFRCRMWDFHDRLEEHISEATCRAEIASFMRYGQLVPALGRVVREDPNYDVELVFGARRLFVARHLNKPLLVDLRESLLDREALIAMDIENRLRSDISPYERGLSFSRWLRTGQFQSQDDVARALKISPSQVSRLLRLAQLPTVVISAFPTPLDIRESWGLELSELLTDEIRRKQIIAKARSIASLPMRPSARDVYRDLLAASTRGRKLRASAHEEVVKDAQGAPLFRIRHQTSSVALIVPIAKASTLRMDRICTMISCILQDATFQMPEFETNAFDD